jgi:hypothetical protein
MEKGSFTKLESSGDPAPQALNVSARLPDFIGRAGAAGDILKDLRLLVIGSGSVGRCMALHAARLLPAALWLIDPGRHDEVA